MEGAKSSEGESSVKANLSSEEAIKKRRYPCIQVYGFTGMPDHIAKRQCERALEAFNRREKCKLVLLDILEGVWMRCGRTICNVTFLARKEKKKKNLKDSGQGQPVKIRCTISMGGEIKTLEKVDEESDARKRTRRSQVVVHSEDCIYCMGASDSQKKSEVKFQCA